MTKLDTADTLTRSFLAALVVVLVTASCAAQPTPTTTPTIGPVPCPTPPPRATGCAPPVTPPPPTATAPATPTAIPTASAAATATPSPKPTPTPKSGLNFQLFATFNSALTFITNAGDGSGRLYLVKQPGQISIIEPDGSVAQQPFLDISSRVSSGGERGLLGLAFHPDYRENGRFYVDYTDVNGNTVVAEYLRKTDETADPASERQIFTVQQPFPNHNGGMLAFAPDGLLYVGMGDGGGAGDPNGNGQNDKSLLGKILRVDVDAAPGSASEPKIWDKGMRNPWRFSFDRQTGDLWIGDVGQGLHEEIDAEPKGTGGFNYGWNIMEGSACFNPPTGCDETGLRLPVATYDHTGNNCAVIGGYVYRGSANPGLVGTYLYGDLCSGSVWGLDAAAGLSSGSAAPARLGNVGAQIASFGEDERGEVYVVEGAGRILSLTYTPPASP